MKKTNVMRMLDKEHIAYGTESYDYDENDLSGVHAAAALGFDPAIVFKTLVAIGDKSGPVVFCIPVQKELDLKKAASQSHNKSVQMVHVKDLLALTGYIRGGCSPIGMKKKFPTYLDETALQQPEISISAGQRGQQVLIIPAALIEFISADTCPLTHD